MSIDGDDGTEMTVKSHHQFLHKVLNLTIHVDYQTVLSAHQESVAYSRFILQRRNADRP